MEKLSWRNHWGKCANYVGTLIYNLILVSEIVSLQQMETDLARSQSELEAENAHAHAADVTSEQLVLDKERLEQTLFEKEAAIQ